MRSAAMVFPSARGAAAACSPLNRPTSTLRFMDMSTNISTQTAMMISKKPLVSSPPSFAVAARTSYSTILMIKERRLISCEVASPTSSSSTTLAQGEGEEPAVGENKIGARVKVKVPLKVYHVPRVPEVDLTGKEGHLKQYVALWKGKRISANLPYKVEFLVDIEGRGPVKFFAHLKEDEFDFLD
ncbi:ferredoxin-thioredoxin reductase, variable chain, chloroplastic [Ricinus communis]|uniref:Lipoic acid synthetase, putative n=1 Tax=Ricinus communis TaxID=3988 RepID=B9RGK8_RICCO|nr:ferredoxin-thioredoxin reductase, variable chain, chloroplastic [Ricinus communis]EEF49663.1 lipoic acid synthetase, putative [Ricinus communis]|eukprot:XP_002513160.1 ferredoxin-thioredoxin reductase, variable chain, chloroplastic [Ricinus communis]